MTTTKAKGRIEAPANKVWPLVTWEAYPELVKAVAGPFTYEGEGIGATRIVAFYSDVQIACIQKHKPRISVIF